MGEDTNNILIVLFSWHCINKKNADADLYSEADLDSEERSMKI